MKRRLTLFLALAYLTSIFFAQVQRARQTSSPPAAQNLKLPGLRDRVTVRRDERGIPYLEANNDEDLYFAQGYVTASDRLWQMDLLRRTVRGELSEIFGANTLASDKTHRTFGFANVVDESANRLPPNLKLAMDAYANGVNAY